MTCRLATTGVGVGGGYRGLPHRRRRRHGACECGAVRRWVGLAEKKLSSGFRGVKQRASAWQMWVNKKCMSSSQGGGQKGQRRLCAIALAAAAHGCCSVSAFASSVGHRNSDQIALTRLVPGSPPMTHRKCTFLQRFLTIYSSACSADRYLS